MKKLRVKLNATIHMRAGMYDVVLAGKYHDGSPALLIKRVDGENMSFLEHGQVFSDPVAMKATVCLSHSGQHMPAKKGRCWIKDWSENAGILESLTQAGIVEPTGHTFEVNGRGDKAHECWLTWPLWDLDESPKGE